MIKTVNFKRQISEAASFDASLPYDLFHDDETGITYIVQNGQFVGKVKNNKGDNTDDNDGDSDNRDNSGDNDNNKKDNKNKSGNDDNGGKEGEEKLSQEEIDKILKNPSKLNGNVGEEILKRIDQSIIDNWYNGEDDDYFNDLDPAELEGLSEEEIRAKVEEQIKKDIADELNISRARLNDLVSKIEHDDLLAEIGKSSKRISKKMYDASKERKQKRIKQAGRNVSTSASAKAVTADIVRHLIDVITSDYVEEKGEIDTFTRFNPRSIALEDEKGDDGGLIMKGKKEDEVPVKRRKIPVITIFYDYSGSFDKAKVAAASEIKEELIKWASKKENQKYKFSQANIVEYYWNDGGPYETNGLPGNIGSGANAADEKVVAKINELETDSGKNKSYNVVIITDGDPIFNCSHGYNCAPIEYHAHIDGTLNLIYYDVKWFYNNFFYHRLGGKPASTDEEAYKECLERGMGYAPAISAKKTYTYLMTSK